MSDTDTQEQEAAAAAKAAEDAKAAETEKEKDPVAEAEKWKALARKHEAQAKSNADAAKKLAELEEADKTEAQKAADRATDAEKRATEAEAKALRLEVAIDQAPEGMPLTQVRKLSRRLAGSTQEELEADAADLFADFTPEKSDKDEDTKRRPKERLRSGVAPEAEPEESDPAKLAAAVPRTW